MKKSNFTGSLGTAELRVPTRRQSKQSRKGGDSQLLLPVADLKIQWKKKGKEELHSFRQNIKRDRGERYFESYYRNGSFPWY
jgi:hypothetical protein